MSLRLGSGLSLVIVAHSEVVTDGRDRRPVLEFGHALLQGKFPYTDTTRDHLGRENICLFSYNFACTSISWKLLDMHVTREIKQTRTRRENCFNLQSQRF